MYLHTFKSLTLVLIVVSIIVIKTCYSHSHNDFEKPSFKYSKEANQQGAKPQQHGHGHAHGGHGHAHSHGEHDHAHSHGSHDHAHSHGGNEHAHSHGSNDHSHDSKEKAEHDTKKRSTESPKSVSVAVKALLATLLISIAPFVILFFIPLNNNSVENQSLLKILLSLASGSLLGKLYSKKFYFC
jgi:zinc transporter 7